MSEDIIKNIFKVKLKILDAAIEGLSDNIRKSAGIAKTNLLDAVGKAISEHKLQQREAKQPGEIKAVTID